MNLNNLIPFENFNLNEAVQSKLLKQLLKDKDTRSIEYLKRRIDLSRLTDNDIEEIKDPTVITKKPYSGSNYMIIIFGPSSTYISGKEDDKGNYVSGHYVTETKLLYAIEQTDVYAIHAKHGGRRRSDDKLPTRKAIIEEIVKDTKEKYKVYAIKFGEINKDDPWNSSNVNKLRNARNNRKANANFATDRDDYNARHAAVNRNRYSEELSKIKDFSHLFETLKDLMQKVIIENQNIIEFFKYFCKDDSTEAQKMYSIKSNALATVKLDSAYAKSFKDFDSAFGYSTDNYTKITLLTKIAEELSDKLMATHKTTEDEIAQIKLLPKLLENFPLADQTDMIKH